VPFELALDTSALLHDAPLVGGRLGGGSKASGTVDATGTVEVPLVPRRRGTAVVQRAWVRYQGPLGLVEMTVRFPLEREIPVVPDVQPVRQVALRFHIAREFRAGHKVERFKGEGTEFDSLKDFTRDDDHRAIDWKQSARHRKLLARQFRAERNHQVMLAVDTGRLMGETLAGIPKLDHAINAALLLAWICLRTGDRVGLYTFDAKVGLLLEPQGGLRAHPALTKMSGRVAYSDAETNFTLGLTTLAQRVRRRSLIVVLTDFVDTLTAELMLENVDRLARRHLVVFVALRDPSLERTAAAEPASSLALNRAVVAQTFLHEREVVLRRLRRLGILPIDTEPQHLGSRMINSYLEIKRREMI
jgi:uncharacterized protein (DUF58 family)